MIHKQRFLQSLSLQYSKPGQLCLGFSLYLFLILKNNQKKTTHLLFIAAVNLLTSINSASNRIYISAEHNLCKGPLRHQCLVVDCATMHKPLQTTNSTCTVVFRGNGN